MDPKSPKDTSSLELDFDDVVDAPTRAETTGRRAGGESLDFDSFFSKTDKEALLRAKGRSTKKNQACRTDEPERIPVEPTASFIPIQPELRLSKRGLPGWVWGLLAALLIGLLIGTGAIVLHHKISNAPVDSNYY